MRTEKSLPTNFEPKSSNSLETKTQMSQIKKWLSSHRTKTRNKILLNPLNFSTIITFFPFAFGLFEFLNKKITSPGTSEIFFHKNLPIFTNFKPKYNYETLKYIVQTNLDCGRIETNFLFGQPQFIAKVKKIDSLESIKFNGLSCNFHFIPSGNFVSKIDERRQILDELPSIVQGLNLEYSNNVLADTVFLTKTKTKISNKIKAHSIQKFNSAKSKKTVFLLKPKIKNTLQLIQKSSSVFPEPDVLKEKSLIKDSSVFNSFYKNRLAFYKTLGQVNLELQNLFMEKQISSFPNNLVDQNPSLATKKLENQKDSIVLEKFLQKNSNLDENLLIESILDNLETAKISQDLPGFRLMSGYTYPDLTANNLQWFYKQNRLFSYFSGHLDRPNSKRKISNSNYSFTIRNLPSILIETKKFLLESHEEKKIFYSGPALSLDSDRALDWKTRGEKSLRFWFHDYISPLNPLTQSHENFFGLYHSPKINLEGKTPEFPEFHKKSLLHESYFPTHQRWDLVRTPVKKPFSPFSASFHIPTETKSADQRMCYGIDVNVSTQEESLLNQQFVPILQIQQPHFQSYARTEKDFEGYSSLFDLGVTAKPDYHFSLDSFNSANSSTKYSSGQYTKTASVFSKTSRLIGSGVDNWEPLTSHSWLVISQLSFAVFIFQILKSLADNYGRELLGYLLDLVAFLGFLDDSLKQEIEILMGQREKGFRIVLNSQKTFTDIVGIQNFLPEIYEVIWFLRNSGRDFALSKTLPRGILLTGPPGTGKTLLVQAIAGEAQVPVVVLSGSSLIEPGESGSVKLEMVFEEARQVAPCIVFIDEIDTLAQKRSQVVHNPMGDEDDELVESLTSIENSMAKSVLEQKTGGLGQQDSEKETENSFQQNPQQLGLLTQLLIELDGIQGRDGVIVIGATNRPEVLDPALLRPGRFDKILQVGLPNKEKRIEILKFYGDILGYQDRIPWNYLGQRTAGFSAADLAALMNESAINAILKQNSHTIETIEHGIDRLTTSESEKYTLLKTISSTSDNDFLDFKVKQEPDNLSVASKLSLLRLAYYQAGKVVLSYVLEMHPNSVVASLWPRRPSIRSVQITTNLQNTIFEFARLCEVQDRLIGCYAGKAAEFLFLQNFSSRRLTHMSTLGLEDLLFAQKLIYSLLEKSFFYSKKSQLQKIITLAPNRNQCEFREFPEKVDFYRQFVETIENPPMKKLLEAETSSLNSKKTSEFQETNDQNFYSIPWWQLETSSTLEFVEKNFANWSRLYLYNPEQNERNPEWFPPDEFYHNFSGLKNIKKAYANLTKQNIQKKHSKSDSAEVKTHTVNLPWNDVANLTRDYPVHSLVLQSFNKALVILNQNRELLDRLAVELLYREILRQPEIEILLKDFQKNESSKDLDLDLKPVDLKNSIKVIESSWGSNSRKPLPRWIDFAQIDMNL